jgi:sRNA-binding protein
LQKNAGNSGFGVMGQPIRAGSGSGASSAALKSQGDQVLCCITTKRQTDMQSKYRIERDRGTKESERQFAVLREKWPRAFPVDNRDLRPLSSNVAREISAAMGWSLPYTLGVLCGWKLGPAYCQAVLRHDQRIGLDGAPTETVDAQAKDLATKRLAQLAARQAAKKVAKAAAPAAKPTAGSTPPAETPPATPAQLRDRVRASLLRRSA